MAAPFDFKMAVYLENGPFYRKKPNCAPKKRAAAVEHFVIIRQVGHCAQMLNYLGNKQLVLLMRAVLRTTK